MGHGSMRHHPCIKPPPALRVPITITYPDSHVRHRILLMALQGNGPETKVTPHL